MLKKAILDTICSTIVLPNKFPMKFSKLVSNYKIQVPEPKVSNYAYEIQSINTDLLGSFASSCGASSQLTEKRHQCQWR